jgi:hypothetical protein
MKKIIQIFTVLLFVLFFNTIYAQNDPPAFDDDVTDIPPAPIDDYLPQVLLTAVVLGWYLVRKEEKKHKKELV